MTPLKLMDTLITTYIFLPWLILDEVLQCKGRCWMPLRGDLPLTPGGTVHPCTKSISLPWKQRLEPEPWSLRDAGPIAITVLYHVVQVVETSLVWSTLIPLGLNQQRARTREQVTPITCWATSSHPHFQRLSNFGLLLSSSSVAFRSMTTVFSSSLSEWNLKLHLSDKWLVSSSLWFGPWVLWQCVIVCCSLCLGLECKSPMLAGETRRWLPSSAAWSTSNGLAGSPGSACPEWTARQQPKNNPVHVTRSKFCKFSKKEPSKINMFRGCKKISELNNDGEFFSSLLNRDSVGVCVHFADLVQ